MIEVFREQFRAEMSPEEKLNRTRELLQILALKIMYDKNLFNNLVFTGGTALRILFNLRRFSEDLDFSLIQRKGYDFETINANLTRGFNLYGLDMQTKVRIERTVHSTLLKFSGLLKELGFSTLDRQQLSIKIEIDTNPPRGGRIENTLINKLYLFNITHFDLSSMYATKLHACFYRGFTKGRDIYDLIWYLGKRTKPNYRLLNNAIRQTEGSSPKTEESNFKAFLLESIKKIDFSKAKKDVERFLEDKNELRLFDYKTIKKIIANQDSNSPLPSGKRNRVRGTNPNFS